MKNSILIIATVVLSILNVNATNKTPKLTTNITKEAIAHIFEWHVETTTGRYSGTSLTLDDAQKMIALTSVNEVITETKITSYYVLKSEMNNHSKRNYFWEVETDTGFAKGYASSENYAHKMISLVASGDAIISKIIISQPQL